MAKVNKEQLPLPDYLIEFARQIANDYDKPERARVETSVTLRRRFRGTSQSDKLGCFMRDGSGQWAGDGPEGDRLMDMFSFQVVKPVIRANQAAMVQARVEIEIEPSSKKKPELQGVAAVANGISKYINNHPDYWSNNLELAINQMSQTDYGYYIHTYEDPDAESPFNYEVDEYSDQPVEEPGEYACAECGAGGPLFSDQMGHATEEGTIPCFKCGEMAEILSYPDESEVPQFKSKQKVSAGNICQDVVSFYQIRVDERKTKNGNMRKARWLEHHYLEDDEDLQAQVPYFNLPEPGEWSYPIRWEYCLETGNDGYLKPWNADMGLTTRARQHEVRKIYLLPSKYRHYVSPSDYTMDRGDGFAAVDAEGNPILSIKQGQKLIDIFPDGFWYVVTSDMLLPLAKACNFLDEWSYGYYLNDAASFHGQPACELNELQRSADTLWTIDVQQRESASINTMLYDRNAWDPEAFEEQLSPTKEGFYLEKGDDLRKHHTLNPAVTQTGTMEGIAFIRSVVGDIGGPQPATLGKTQPGVAYASQALQREQSLGLLTPSQMSKAECKGIVTLQHLKHAQRCRPRAWFEYIATMYGEEWKDQDIDDFLESNLDLDLRIDYKQGSEQPNSLIQQELKTRQFVVDAAQIMSGSKDPAFMQEQMLMLMAQYAKTVGLDFDLGNTDAQDRLTMVRFNKISEWLKANDDGEMPINVLVDIAMASDDLRPMPRENHKVAIEALVDTATAQMAEEEPNYPLIKCLLKLMDRHADAGVDKTQTDVSNDMEGQAPMLAAQAAMAQQQAQGAAAAEQEKAKAAIAMEQEKAKAEIAKETAKIQANAADKERQRQFDAQQSELDRQHEADHNSAELALKSADLAATHGNSQTSAQKVSESMNYKDLPPPAQSALLEQVGLPSDGTEEVHASNIAAQKAKAASSQRPLA